MLNSAIVKIELKCVNGKRRLEGDSMHTLYATFSKSDWELLSIAEPRLQCSEGLEPKEEGGIDIARDDVHHALHRIDSNPLFPNIFFGTLRSSIDTSKVDSGGERRMSDFSVYGVGRDRMPSRLLPM